MSSTMNSSNKQLDPSNKNQSSQQSSSQSNSLGLAQQVQSQKDSQNGGSRAQAYPDSNQPATVRKNSNSQQNDKQNSQIKNGNHQKEVNVNYSDDEVRINPELEKFFKKREFIEEISKPMLRFTQDRFGDVKSGSQGVGAHQSVNNQRRALQQMGLINKQEQSNESNKLNKLKRYSDKLSNAIKSLQTWEEPLMQMGVAKTLDEKFELAEKMLNRWQDLGLVDGPETEQMMMKYPEYGDQIQNESQMIRKSNNGNNNHTPSERYHQSQNTFNKLNREEVDEEDNLPRSNFKIRNNRDGSQSTRNKNGTQEQFRSIQQSPRLNTEKVTKDEQSRTQQHYLLNNNTNNMFTPQNKFRKSSQQNPKRNNLLDEQIIRNLNETKFLEDQKNLIMSNNFNQSKPSYQQKLSSTQPMYPNGQNHSSAPHEYGNSGNITTPSNGHSAIQARPRLRTPKRSEKINAPPEYNEAISNEIEKQYRMRYSSAEPHQNVNHNLYESTPVSNHQKYGTSFNQQQPSSSRKENYGNTYRSGDENEVSSLFPQIHNYSETFKMTSGNKLKNSSHQQRAETPKRKTNYGTNAYPHGQFLGQQQQRGSTPKYSSRNQQ